MEIDERTSQYGIFSIRTVPRAARFSRIRMMYLLYLDRPLYGKNIIWADDSGIFSTHFDLVMYRKNCFNDVVLQSVKHRFSIKKLV